MCGYIAGYNTLTTKDAISVLESQPIADLGTMGQCSVEIVPMYYVTSYYNNELVVYLMIISNGESMNNMISNSVMTLLVTQILDTKPKGTFNSVVAKGCYEKVTNPKEKSYIRYLFNEKYVNHPDALQSYDYHGIYYVRMKISQITGRAYYKTYY